MGIYFELESFVLYIHQGSHIPEVPRKLELPEAAVRRSSLK